MILCELSDCEEHGILEHWPEANDAQAVDLAIVTDRNGHF